MICFHFSNFEPLETASYNIIKLFKLLWFAFILVTLSHWKQRRNEIEIKTQVVICFHFSNFEPLETAWLLVRLFVNVLWFAFILVTLSHWKQQVVLFVPKSSVVICFHFSNFEPLETARTIHVLHVYVLWFAFILVTLSHWKQRYSNTRLVS